MGDWMNKKKYGVSLVILILVSLIILSLGVITSEYLVFGLSGFILFLVGFYILERQKDWVHKDERTVMIESKASHYTLITFIVMGFIISFIFQYGGIDETSGIVLRITVLLVIIVRSIIWGHLNRKYS